MLVLFDFSNIVYTAFFSALRDKKLKPEDVPEDFTAHVGVFSNRVKNCMSQLSHFYNGPIETIFALDCFPKWKYDLLPSYKSNRKSKSWKVRPKNLCLALVSNWDAKRAFSDGMEADDVLATLAARNYEDRPVTVVSTDKDLWHICSQPNTYFFNHMTNDFLTQDKLEADYGLKNYCAIKGYKSLWGDASDCIPNVLPRAQKQFLAPLDRFYGDVFTLNAELDNLGIDEKWTQRFKEAWPDIQRNEKLVALNYNSKIQWLEKGERLSARMKVKPPEGEAFLDFF